MSSSFSNRALWDKFPVALRTGCALSSTRSSGSLKVGLSTTCGDLAAATCLEGDAKEREQEHAQAQTPVCSGAVLEKAWTHWFHWSTRRPTLKGKTCRARSTSANFDFGQFFFEFGQLRLRPISTSANFDFGQLFDVEFLDHKGLGPKPRTSGVPKPGHPQ